MKDMSEVCTLCMQDKGKNYVCPHCGFDGSENSEAPHHLKRGSVLRGKYWVGNSVDESGFAITYVGYDMELEQKVAIKEFFPGELISRDSSLSDAILTLSEENKKLFGQGCQKVLSEAKILSSLGNLAGIESIKDFFSENGTVYTVTEYTEGETLEAFLQRNGGKTNPEFIFHIMKPLIRGMEAVHNQGIIHGYISPENIKIIPGSGSKLLDFGVAREVCIDANERIAVDLKHGYAAEEQYSDHVDKGPYTDVYAICATIYRAITGVRPVQALERSNNSKLTPPSAFGVAIAPDAEEAIMRGLAVFSENRLENMRRLYDALYAEKNVYPTGDNLSKTHKKETHKPAHARKRSPLTAIIAILVSAILCTCAVFGIFFIKDYIVSENNEESTTTSDESKDKEKDKSKQAEKEKDKTKITARQKVSPTPDASSAPTTTPEDIPTPTPQPEPIFTKVAASSTRGIDMTSGSPVDYIPEYAIDGNYSTTWSADRDIELNPTLTIYADSKQYVKGIRMSNGYFKSEETYTRNRRITKVKIEYDGGSITKTFDIDQYRIMQDIKFDTPVQTSYIRIQVLETYYGDWKDICISEVEVY